MNITRISSLEEVKSLIEALNKIGKPVALDLETTGLDPFKDTILTVVISGTKPDTAFVFNPEFAECLLELTPGLILHNYKFDYHFLYRMGVDLRGHDVRDTMLMHHLIDENSPHSLDSIIQEIFKDNYKEDFWAKHQKFEDASPEAQDEYAGKDVIYTLKIYHLFTAQISKMDIPSLLVKNIHNFSLHLLNTEIEGICVDLESVKNSGLKTLVKIDRLNDEMLVLVAGPVSKIEASLYKKELDKRKTEKGKANVKRPKFSFGSTSQLQSLLYDELKLPVQKSPQRKVTVDDNALSKLESYHPLVALLRQHRGEQKLFSAFLEGALDKSRGGRIYPSFSINGTVTGRISASNPNLQQLPATGGIRAIYIPAKDCSFISADYKQLEVTLAAHFSRDKNLLRVVTEGVSLHDLTARGLGIDRNLAKTINFAIQYGAGVGKIRKILGCGEKEAQEALDKYWKTYPGLKVLIDRCHKAVDAGAAICNPFGRQRHLSIPKDANKWEAAAVKRQAFNSLIQGTGADITNQAFTIISEELAASGDGRGLFVVHDEILIEVKDTAAAYWDSRLCTIMMCMAEGLTVSLHSESSGPMKAWLD